MSFLPTRALFCQLYESLRQSGPRVVAFTVLPELVRFRDINDPHTLAVVSPDDHVAVLVLDVRC
jgi:hypothetical protein